MTKLPLYALAIGLLALPLGAHAQNFLGLASQSNGGFYAAYQNPALLAGQAHKYQLHLVSAGVNLNNNYVRYAAPFSMLDLIQGKNSRPLDPYDLKEVGGRGPKNATLAAELRGPAFSAQLGEKTTLALMSRVRSGFQVTDASNRLMAIARVGLADASNLQELGYLALYASQSENRFNLSSMAYSEWAFSWGQVLSETDYARLRAGVTVKRYLGNAAGYMQNQNLNYRLLPDAENSNTLYMQVDNFEATMGYTDINRRDLLSPGLLFGRNRNGQGWGWDAGISYEILDDTDFASVRLSASITDMGQIRFESPVVKNYSIRAENQQITEEEWRGYSSPREGENQLSAFGRLLEEEFGLEEDNNTGNFTMATPTALNLTADLKLSSAFFVNATVIQGIKRTGIPQWRQTSLWAVTPRLEWKAVGIALPIVRQNKTWALGAGVRLGPLRVGSDNLAGLFSREGQLNAQGVDLYAGLSFHLKGKTD
jgi:hypothetical protein